LSAELGFFHIKLNRFNACKVAVSCYNFTACKFLQWFFINILSAPKLRDPARPLGFSFLRIRESDILKNKKKPAPFETGFSFLRIWLFAFLVRFSQSGNHHDCLFWARNVKVDKA